MHEHDSSTNAHRFTVDGRPVAGAAPDQHGRWTWWAVSTSGRRVAATSEQDAVAQAIAACAL